MYGACPFCTRKSDRFLLNHALREIIIITHLIETYTGSLGSLEHSSRVRFISGEPGSILKRIQMRWGEFKCTPVSSNALVCIPHWGVVYT